MAALGVKCIELRNAPEKPTRVGKHGNALAYAAELESDRKITSVRRSRLAVQLKSDREIVSTAIPLPM
eukprot:2830988-Amphidinium_carterae.1